MAPGLSGVPALGLLPMTCPSGMVGWYVGTELPNSRFRSWIAAWASSSVSPRSFGTSYLSRPSDTTAVTVPSSRTRSPASGSVLMISPLATVSEYAVSATRKPSPALSIRTSACAAVSPMTPGVLV